MPADLRTELPTKHKGENRLAKQLAASLGPDAHLWFGLNTILKVPDIDVTLWHDSIGVFVIEVKAVPINAIESFGTMRCVIRGRDDDRPPQRQIRDARDDLLGHLEVQLGKRPWVTATVCFPKITRAEWRNHWDNDAFTAGWADGVIFADDLGSGREVLEARLRHIRHSPAVPNGTNYPFTHDAEQLERFHQAICPMSMAKPAPSDVEKLRGIERRVAADALAEAPPGRASNLVFTGYPGTGKTFRLLEIGVGHALSGGRVLYSCFNKVLAADVSRILGASDRLDHENAQFQSRDVFELAAGYAKDAGIAYDEDSEESYDEWGEAVTALVEADPDEIPRFGTVLLDEAQDMTGWQLRLLRCHVAEGGSLIVAAGGGQELYGERSDEFRSIVESSTHYGLRRNFRNTRPTFQVAQVAFDAKLDPASIKSAASRFKKQGQSPQGMLFERSEGRYPMFRLVDLSSLDWDDAGSYFFVEQQRDLFVSAYADLIAEQLEDLSERERPLDLLLLVPSGKSHEAERVREALGRLDQRYVDLTKEQLRRVGVPSTHVRLCTFHSARGIEGNRVLIFGLNSLPAVSEHAKVAVENLAYIVLSRSVFETVIVTPEYDARKGPGEFVGGVLRHLQT